MCCLQEVRWRGKGSRMLGMKARRYKLWWSGRERIGSVEIMEKEQLCEMVVEVRMEMTVAVAFEDVLRLIIGHAP